MNQGGINMTYQAYTEQDIRNAMAVGLDSLTKLARVKLKTRWKQMSLKERCDAARALVNMNAVAKKPEDYFSRAATQQAWNKRANEYAQEKNLKDVSGAYYIVQDPTGLVWDSATGAFFDGNGSDYYNFCRLIQNWEYNNIKGVYADEILNLAKVYTNKLELVSANGFARPFVEIKQAFQR
jgi:hypothetical protein